MSLLQPELLSRLARSFPEGVAWKDLADGSELQLGSWDAQSNRLARGLHQQGLRPGDRVGLAITEGEPLRWLISYMAVHKAGGVAVPLNTRLRGPELVRILRHADVAVLLASDDILAGCPEIASLAGTVATTTGGPGARYLPWHELLHEDAGPPGHRIGPDDVADIMYTSGTTGEPKGVAVHHGGLSSTDRVPDAWLGLGFLTSSPFSTTSGSLLVCGPMRGGVSGWFLPRFDASRWLDVVETARPAASFMVPTMVQLVVAHPRAATADLTSLAVVNIGSAPISSSTLRRFGELVPSAHVMCGYGMTEFGAVTATPMGDRGDHLGSVGTPLPGVEVRILDPAGREVPPGETGQIAIRGARGQRTYFRDPEASRAIWPDGWLRSGDLGYLDADGFLWVVGRLREMIIRGGHNIAPGEVEEAFYRHRSVVEAAVVGVPHPVLGEDVAAWVVLDETVGTTAEELRAYLLEQLADYKVPRRITLTDALPRNEAGKVLKAQLVSADEQRSQP